MYDIISLGDSTLDTFVQLNEATVNCNINKDSCQFCFNYADKIPVTSWATAIGGNAANHAMALSRLGRKAALWTIVGNDKVGQQVKAAMRREKVATSLIKTDAAAPTNQSFIINFQGERTILIHHNHRHYVLPKLPPSRWVYLTSMGEGSARVFPALARHLKQKKIKLGFNPGTFQLKLGAAKLKGMLKLSDALFLNVEEAARLLGKPAAKDWHTLSGGLQKLGPKIIVITDGQNGAHAWDGARCFSMPILTRAPVVERTGAGDAFASGFVGALLYGETVSEALRWGTFNSASVIGQIGPQAGLLTLREMKRQLIKYKNLLAQAC